MRWESLHDALKRLEDGTPPPPGAGLFGASPRPEDCRLVLLPVPWDTTVSYGAGTAEGPAAILAASHQLDLEDACFAQPYRAGIAMLAPDPDLVATNIASRPLALQVIEAAQHQGGASDHAVTQALARVNAASARVNDAVERAAQIQFDAGRLVGVLGGDHSAPFGLIKALGAAHPDGFGILHFDAHLDLREAYEGFAFSHASIMHNVMERVPAVRTLVQVGIRDYSADESRYARRLADGGRGRVFYARELFRRKAAGESWAAVTRAIIAGLPPKVYVSFDIDGLDPTCCPSTGTPVPGGLSFEEAVFVLEELALSGRRIIGFDLCEVAPGEDGDEWDANVGARILYKLCGATLFANGHVAAADETPLGASQAAENKRI